jgi:rfaE bifunctional protein nucleotidyltransferase chain/domain
MNKFMTPDQTSILATRLHRNGKKSVLVGGCFDILHVGHIAFLNAAKKEGDVLVVMLESDESITKTKGRGRPINTQDDRALILASLAVVDFVIKLPLFDRDDDYDNLVISLKPAIIATTKGDRTRSHKERQAEKIGAKVVDVTFPVVNKSTTRLVSILKESL